VKLARFIKTKVTKVTCFLSYVEDKSKYKNFIHTHTHTHTHKHTHTGHVSKSGTIKRRLREEEKDDRVNNVEIHHKTHRKLLKQYRVREKRVRKSNRGG
jgi:hypothetical protein